MKLSELLSLSVYGKGGSGGRGGRSRGGRGGLRGGRGGGRTRARLVRKSAPRRGMRARLVRKKRR